MHKGGRQVAPHGAEEQPQGLCHRFGGNDSHVPQPGSGPSQAAPGAAHQIFRLEARAVQQLPEGIHHQAQGNVPAVRHGHGVVCTALKAGHHAEGNGVRIGLFRRAGALILFVICHLEKLLVSQKGMRGPAAARHVLPGPPARPEEGKTVSIYAQKQPACRAGKPAACGKTARHSPRQAARGKRVCLFVQ